MDLNRKFIALFNVYKVHIYLNKYQSTYNNIMQSKHETFLQIFSKSEILTKNSNINEFTGEMDGDTNYTDSLCSANL